MRSAEARELRKQQSRRGIHLALENLKEEVGAERDFAGIVGQSSTLRKVLDLVIMVAPIDSTVLLFRRDRDRQGTHCLRDSRSQSPEEPQACESELRCNSPWSARKRTL